ncbi:hypothetical protein TNCV_635541 [Trichonephila clavipes]|nr:hypothetical protein TNCV_635541 [Trichonephila clavipes]
MACASIDVHAASTRCHSSRGPKATGSHMGMSQSLGNHGPDVYYWREYWGTCRPGFVVDYTSEDTPVCDAESRVAADMVSVLRVHAAAYGNELLVQTLVSQFLTQGS